MSVFSAAGEISADVFLTIMTNESSVVPDDYMSLDGIRGASNDPSHDRASTSAGRVIRTKPIHDPMNAANPV